MGCEKQWAVKSNGLVWQEACELFPLGALNSTNLSH